MPNDIIDDRRKALDDFARDDRPKQELMIPQTAMMGDQRVIGAQKVAVYRDEGRVLQKLATLAAAAGDDWYYRYPVKKRVKNDNGTWDTTTDWIEGPSIKLANDLARLYGNCDVDVREVDVGDAWVFFARFTDFETGFSLTRPYRQNKGGSKMGGDDSARRLDIAYQIGASKASRNCVRNALQTFADYAFEEAKNALVEKIGSNLEKWRARAIDKISASIDVRRVERVVGRVAANWLAPDIAMIVAMWKAVEDGMATMDESFPPISAPQEEGTAQPAGKLDEFGKTEAKPAEAKTEPAKGGKKAAKAKAEDAASDQGGKSDAPAKAAQEPQEEAKAAEATQEPPASENEPATAATPAQAATTDLVEKAVATAEPEPDAQGDAFGGQKVAEAGPQTEQVLAEIIDNAASLEKLTGFWELKVEPFRVQLGDQDPGKAYKRLATKANARKRVLEKQAQAASKGKK